MLDFSSRVKVKGLLTTAMPTPGGVGCVRTPLHDPWGSSHEEGLCEISGLLPLLPEVCTPLTLLSLIISHGEQLATCFLLLLPAPQERGCVCGAEHTGSMPEEAESRGAV